MGLLDTIDDPRDLRHLDDEQLSTLAEEVRERLITSVAANGGHLGPNLGVVELTIAIHRIFASPSDRVVFDTGHQAYVHKMLTGRADQFDALRKEGGLSGYPSQAESEHDVIENSHASTSLSYADGLAKANTLADRDDHVVAVIGDGALTGGMAWEALNNIATDQSRRLVIVVNDNGRSYMPTVGGLANHLATLRTNPRYEPTLQAIKGRLKSTKVVGPKAYDTLHAIKKGLKDAIAPQGMFEDLGLKYLGPIDGHDRDAVEHALSLAKRYGGPVLVHVLTTKGKGYDIAVANEVDQMHQAPSGGFDPETGDAIAAAPASWTSVFRD
ncbi:MAG TPA: 1-deoxy-D-xylulose-5-phosphate synthase N-terminal domain-containing protein, partial [Nocardioidaceae bacterium]|nr:1-deoxy-D-xylulose-5-phosphate synthase N-terminal domain-containing protein [Nocardioidaceae bacterium]